MNHSSRTMLCNISLFVTCRPLCAPICFPRGVIPSWIVRPVYLHWARFCNLHRLAIFRFSTPCCRFNLFKPRTLPAVPAERVTAPGAPAWSCRGKGARRASLGVPCPS